MIIYNFYCIMVLMNSVMGRNICLPGSTECLNNTLRVCDVNGLWVVVDCPSGTECNIKDKTVGCVPKKKDKILSDGQPKNGDKGNKGNNDIIDKILSFAKNSKFLDKLKKELGDSKNDQDNDEDDDGSEDEKPTKDEEPEKVDEEVPETKEKNKKKGPNKKKRVVIKTIRYKKVIEPNDGKSSDENNNRENKTNDKRNKKNDRNDSSEKDRDDNDKIKSNNGHNSQSVLTKSNNDRNSGQSDQEPKQITVTKTIVQKQKLEDIDIELGVNKKGKNINPGVNSKQISGLPNMNNLSLNIPPFYIPGGQNGQGGNDKNSNNNMPGPGGNTQQHGNTGSSSNGGNGTGNNSGGSPGGESSGGSGESSGGGSPGGGSSGGNGGSSGGNGGSPGGGSSGGNGGSSGGNGGSPGGESSGGSGESSGGGSPGGGSSGENGGSSGGNGGSSGGSGESSGGSGASQGGESSGASGGASGDSSSGGGSSGGSGGTSGANSSSGSSSSNGGSSTSGDSSKSEKESSGSSQQGSSGGAGGSIKSENIMSAVKKSGYQPNQSYVNAIVKEANNAFKDKNEGLMFLAQMAHETGGFKYLEEIACAGSTKCAGQYGGNEGVPGKSYHGRGFIQLSWPANYKEASKALGMGDKLYQNPDLVAKDVDIAAKTAKWFWEKNVAPKLKAAGGKKFGVTTKAINGALECTGQNVDKSKKRYKFYTDMAEAEKLSDKASESGCYN